MWDVRNIDVAQILATMSRRFIDWNEIANKKIEHVHLWIIFTVPTESIVSGAGEYAHVRMRMHVNMY